jgi:hypothetical protein
VDPIRGGGAFVHQLIAVLAEHPEIRGVVDHGHGEGVLVRVNACVHPVFSNPILVFRSWAERRHLRGYVVFPHAPIERQQPRRAAAGRHPLPRASGMPGSKRLSLPGGSADPDDVEATDIFT